MLEENVRAVRDATDAYARGDKRAWTNLMDPELETVPLPEWPESGPFIGPDAAWDFYKHFEEMFLEGRRTRSLS
jgi:ketosteroid isomerase-like protein